MNQKIISTSIAVIGVILGIAFSVISAAATSLQPFIPLAWIVIVVGTLLLIYFNVGSDINLRFFLLFNKREWIGEYRESYNAAENMLSDDPLLEDGSADVNQLRSWIDIGRDLKFMSWIYQDAGTLLIDLMILVGPAMLRNSRQDQFISLGSTAFKRAENSGNRNTAAKIAYYMVLAYFTRSADLRINDGHKWVTKLENIYNNHQDREIQALLLHAKGLLSGSDPGKRAEAKDILEQTLQLAEQPGLATKSNITRMCKDIYKYLGDLNKKDSLFDQALGCYEKALDPTSKDFSKQLEIYEELGELALRIQPPNYQKAELWYKYQLELATVKSYLLGQRSAHKGLAKTLFKKSPPDIENAYRHINRALIIVKEHISPHSAV